METKTLKKPVFIKINQLEPIKHCYNIYCQVMDVTVTKSENSRGQEQVVAEGVVADETGCVKFRLRNEHTTHIKKGAVIALRNGRSNIVDDTILLDLDKFGKVS